MFNWLFEIFAPSTFTKGIYRYNRGEYSAAEKLFKKASKWMPELKNDSLYEAYLFLTVSKLDRQINPNEIREILGILTKSTLKNHNSYIRAEAELIALLKEIDSSIQR